MAKIWTISRRAKFHEVGPNIFVVEFANQKDKQRIMEERPWLFDNHLYLLLTFDGFTPPHKMLFNTKRFWVQLHKLPLKCMNKKGEFVGGMTGRVVEVDTKDDGNG